MRQVDTVRDLISQVERYLRDTLGVTVRPVPWRAVHRLPTFLTERYEFFEATVKTRHCVLMADKEVDEQLPATVRKHLEQAQRRSAGPVVYVRPQIAACNREQLIEQRVPFVVPRKELFLPMLGIHLGEFFGSLRAPTHVLNPATQVALIYALLRVPETDLTAGVLAPVVGYSLMTMSRTFDQLEHAGLGRSIRRGRERHFRLVAPKPELWDMAQPLLRSPVVRRLRLRRHGSALSGPRAGSTALAEYSALAEPATPVVAMSMHDWRACRQAGLTEVPAHEPDAVGVEVWSYNPAVAASAGTVDPLSLYLSLRGTGDERVEAALDAMLRSLWPHGDCRATGELGGSVPERLDQQVGECSR